MWIHITMDYDLEAGTVDCRNCGTVRLVWNHGRPYCSVARTDSKKRGTKNL